jgi:hypothetical protein
MRYEYKVVAIGSPSELQGLLDLHARDGWRLAETYQAMGYTRSLIFERPVDPPAAAAPLGLGFADR